MSSLTLYFVILGLALTHAYVHAARCTVCVSGAFVYTHAWLATVVRPRSQVRSDRPAQASRVLLERLAVAWPRVTAPALVVGVGVAIPSGQYRFFFSQQLEDDEGVALRGLGRWSAGGPQVEGRRQIGDYRRRGDTGCKAEAAISAVTAARARCATRRAEEQRRQYLFYRASRRVRRGRVATTAMQPRRAVRAGVPAAWPGCVVSSRRFEYCLAFKLGRLLQMSNLCSHRPTGLAVHER